MRIKTLSHLGVAPIAIGMALFSAPVAAQSQDADAQATADQDDDTTVTPAGESSSLGGAIVVTGTRIQRPNLDSPNPVTSLSLGEIQSTGEVNLGDALNDLPSLRSTFSQQNSTRFIGTAGLNLIDLRGLGTNRTLVLVNGRRHITSQPGVPTSVDVNTIPSALVERIDIVTGGNSAVYGADAVAGVVNFILKRDYEGVEGRVQAGVADHGGRGTYTASLIAGKNFADGRGNITVAGEYSEARGLYNTDRDDLTGAYSGRRQLQQVENTIGEPAGGNGIPDRVFVEGIRNINISEGGLFTSSCSGSAARQAFNCTGQNNQSGNPLGFTFAFAPNGNLIRNVVSKDLRTVGSGNAVGGLGSTLLLTGQLAPETERYTANVLASFEVSPAFRPFVEAKYVRIDAIQEGQPTFFNNTFSLNNPFLTAQARSTLQQSLAPGATSFSAFRFNTDFGGRGEQHRRETYRIVAGVDGTFNDDWGYEVAFNYGRLDTFYRTEGNVNIDRYFNSIDAVRNGAGNIVCAINADAGTANDDPACVPVNLFGQGAPSAAALNYIVTDSTREQRADQYQATAYVNGDLSQLFELPGGPIGFALGAEYRKETAFSAFDEFTRSGGTFLNAIPVFDPEDLEVYEAYGEVRIPLLANIPFAEELTVEGAFRVSDYNLGNVGTVETYNGGVVWAPFRSFRLRGSYARSVRVPTQSDLLAAPSQTFLNGLVDPCDSRFINDNPNRAANCAADGVPTTVLVNGVSQAFTNIPASGIRGLNGSNPNLDAEVSDSYTLGAVFQPEFVPGLSFTVDYYNISIDNVIFSLAPQTIINQCYDSPSGINNQYCAAVFRRPDGTFQGQSDRQLGGSTISLDVAPTDRSFISGPFNFAKQKTSGIDFDLNYQRDFGAVALNFRGLLSYVINRDNYTDIDDPNFINQQLLELGDPEFAGSMIVGLDFGVPRVTYNLRYIGEQFVNTFETFNPLQGRPAENPDYSFPIEYPETFYHNIRVDLEMDSNFGFYVGVDNLLDTLPPLGLDGTGSGSGQYDNIGRFLYAGARFDF
ncbi:TonB-dependent receptor domain-containing protein [Novosphingopyxis baekryungensis]|uniref:TonB-dependent receptor domain-containing protein n=1 Tax=Novosphingopyxis baekryungensis TaxID=279369 RepID=UPI0003B5A634|nr:TonB-dependent receptor [Novosphingopyxis baekryungensis]